MNLIRLFMVLLVSVFCLGASCSDVKPVLPRALDVAEQLCLLLSAEQKPGLSPREVAEQLCKTEAQLRPFLDYVLRAKQLGVSTAEPATTVTVTVVSPDAAVLDGPAE
jgi:hypothetical protein